MYPRFSGSHTSRLRVLKFALAKQTVEGRYGSPSPRGPADRLNRVPQPSKRECGAFCAETEIVVSAV